MLIKQLSIVQRIATVGNRTAYALNAKGSGIGSGGNTSILLSINSSRDACFV